MANNKQIKRKRSNRVSIDDLYYSEVYAKKKSPKKKKYKRKKSLCAPKTVPSDFIVPMGGLSYKRTLPQDIDFDLHDAHGALVKLSDGRFARVYRNHIDSGGRYLLYFDGEPYTKYSLSAFKFKILEYFIN